MGDAMLESISIADLKRLSNINIIDIRNSEKYNDNHILHAHNIPFNDLLLYPYKYLKLYDIYYIYCPKGIKSKQLCRILNSKGYHTINIIGGYEEYVLNS